MFFGAIEAGGTKWICALSAGSDELLDVQEIPTGLPPKTIAAAQAFFTARRRPNAIGIASFGPLELDPCSPAYGRITTTPKPGWTDTDIISPFSDAVGVPVSLDSDVNAAALAEARRGAGKGLQNVVYVTVGTGIGAGSVVRGAVLRGRGHPEFGHVRIPHDHDRDPFKGSCPYHRDCLEGLASGESMRRRWGRPAEEIESEAAWDLEAHYLGLAVMNLVLTLAPERIVLGGSVSTHPGLLEAVRASAAQLLARYGRPSADDFDQLIVAPALGSMAGVHGGIELAQDLYARLDDHGPARSLGGPR